MAEEITKRLEEYEWYEAMIEECKAITVEGVFRSRMELIETYHKLGERILEENKNFKRAKIYGKKIVSRVAESLGQSERTIWRALQFAEKFPDLDKLPEGKNISWHKIVQNYLPEPKKEHQCEFEEVQLFKCKICGKIKK